MVRDVLAPLGWEPTRKDRVPGWRLFRSGKVFQSRLELARKALAGPNALTADQRATAVVDALKAGRLADPGTVDDFLEEKRAEARREAAR
jgi:hypothetical protein